jgi:hypothetical protein
MALNTSGPISLGGSTTGQSVNLELGQGATTTISFNDAAVRTLTGTSSGTSLTMPGGFYGKARRIPITVNISGSAINYVASTAKASGYIAGISDVTFVIASGVAVGSPSTGSYAFNVDTSWSSGDTVTVVNYGYIYGRGGTGGAGKAVAESANSGASGGPAMLVQFPTTVTNSGIIGGGGGGGGAGVTFVFKGDAYYGGGGGSGQGFYGGGGGASYGNPGQSGRNPGGSDPGSPGAGGAGISGTAGGAGGTLGSAGVDGDNWNPSYFSTGVGGAGGAALVGKVYVNGGAGILGSGSVYGGQS